MGRIQFFSPHIDFFSFEKRAWRSHRHVAGLDEVGRGAWAGPVTAAAVVFSPDVRIDGVRDSKVLTPKKREELFPMICEKALSFGIGFIDSQVIDEINILEATKTAMIQAVQKLSLTPDHLLVDGQMALDLKISQESIIDGDALSFTIAAASILAKVARDRLMVDFSRRYPGYGFEKHKGYGTKIHREALERRGCLPIHRRSYRPVQEFL